MNKPTGMVLMLAALLMLGSCKTKKEAVALPIPQHHNVDEHSAHVFIVMYDAEVGKEPLQKAIKAYGCEIVYDYNIIPGMALKKPEDKSLEETMQYFRGVKGVLTVEYDRITRLVEPVKPRLEIQ